MSADGVAELTGGQRPHRHVIKDVLVEIDMQEAERCAVQADQDAGLAVRLARGVERLGRDDCRCGQLDLPAPDQPVRRCRPTCGGSWRRPVQERIREVGTRTPDDPGQLRGGQRSWIAVLLAQVLRAVRIDHVA